ncbi:FadR family transcriptional regulator [Yimella sp. RIT 621]|uniref:FadR/GntR family transcriptional regulator n=1 Tax=Yimella sp. RIT 621 TaxID=2510323 RepID=UPI00101C0C82|nr:FCD domain-containing protein [Yimella sp. RIT 621]RYG76499.1 FadR family transcriptional regulator [Yimella sp. RIT 621]
MRRSEPVTATTAIKELILERGLRPGEPMPTENELVELLGISRSSVREAVRTLVALDILAVKHGRGTFVGEVSLRPLVEGMVFRGVMSSGDDYRTLREVVELRTTLDLAMADHVVESLAGQDSSELRALTAQMRERVQQGKSFADADRAFHEGLAGLQNNDLFAQIVGALWEIHATISPKLGLPTSRDMHDTANAHVELLDRAAAGDLEGYRAAVVAHYAPLLRVIDKTYATVEA